MRWPMESEEFSRKAPSHRRKCPPPACKWSCPLAGRAEKFWGNSWLRVYVEGSQPLGEGNAVFSSIAAAAWESKALTVRVNYVLQGAHYFPLAGYFIGDRRGPFAEIRLRPWKRVDLYAAASNYRNNLEKDRNATGMASTTTSAGVTLSLQIGRAHV